MAAGVFSFFKYSSIIQAQTPPLLCLGGCQVVMPNPVSGQNISGQTEIQAGILGVDQELIGQVYIEAYQLNSDMVHYTSIGNVLCGSWSNYQTNHWKASCDTIGLPFQSTSYWVHFQVHAKDIYGRELPLKLATGDENGDPANNPIFGQFLLENRFAMIYPTSFDVTGFQNFMIESTGDLAGASLQVVPYTNPYAAGTMIPLVRQTGSPDTTRISNWAVNNYNTADISNDGMFSIFLHYTPLYQTTNIKFPLPLKQISIQNSCLGDPYVCDTWSSCIDGYNTRICTLVAGCPSSSTKPSESQECTATGSILCPTTMPVAEQWICPTVWSACLNGTQTRSCIANSSCTPIVPAPDSQTCTNTTPSTACPTTMAADVQWSCSATWSACLNGTQTRSCTPNMTCVPVVPAPNRQTCTVPGQSTIPAPTITDPTPNSIHRHVLFAVKGKAQPGFSVRITVDGNRVDGSVNAGTDGNYYYLLKTPLNPGTHTVYAQTISPDGNSSSLQSPTVTVQLARPSVTIIEPVGRQTVFGDSQRVLASVNYDDPQSVVEFSLRPADSTANETLLCTGLRNDLTQPKSFNCTWRTSSYTDGNYSLIARVKIRTGLVYASPIVLVTVRQTVNPTEPPATDTAATDAQTQAATDNVDSDGDGLPDSVEAQLQTDPNNPDSDGDGISDGTEANSLKTDPLAMNPTSALPAQSEAVVSEQELMVFEEPTKNGIETPEKLAVNEITNYSPIIGQNNLVISGIGPPNSTIYIYIYSTPVVVTTKTDASGNFTYTLDKNLADGRHEVYVTVNDQTGKIQEKSSPLAFFVRKAVAVSETDYLRGDVNVSASGDTSMSRYIVIALSAVAAVLVVLLGARYLTKKSKPV
ncbi:MAG: Ig-like domain-containing protein [Patescibacteria group bacterium]